MILFEDKLEDYSDLDSTDHSQNIYILDELNKLGLHATKPINELSTEYIAHISEKQYTPLRKHLPSFKEWLVISILNDNNISIPFNLVESLITEFKSQETKTQSFKDWVGKQEF